MCAVGAGSSSWKARSAAAMLMLGVRDAGDASLLREPVPKCFTGLWER